MASDVRIYHNPRCSKCRATLALLQDRGVEPEQRLYLNEAPSADEVRELLTLLGVEPLALVRQKEAEFAESGLSADSDADAVAEAIARFPKLLERPVVVRGDRAIIGRPPENVLELL